MRGWDKEPLNPAVCVGVPRGRGARDFVLALVVETLPKPALYKPAPHGDRNPGLSFGVGRSKQKASYDGFGGDTGTCGLRQQLRKESGRHASANKFGRRVDRDDDKLGPVIQEGSRLALRLSARGPDQLRTARFFVDGSEVAVFADIEDTGGDADWVAGALPILPPLSPPLSPQG